MKIRAGIGGCSWHNVRAFTTVELIVTILLVGIISTMAVFGYGAWRDRLALAEVRSDLLNVKAAMDNHKAWNNGYPELEDDAEFNGNPATVSLFTQSPNVKVVYFEGDSKAYCIDGVSQVRPNIGLYITSDSNGTMTEPTRGTCFGGEGAHTTPTGDEWIQFVYDMNAPGCSGSTIRLPIGYPNNDPGSRIDWGDGKSETRKTPNPQHTYKKARKYIVSYRPGSQTVPTAINTSVYGATPETKCITEVRQWGNGSPTRISLPGTSNLTKVPNQIPESVTDLSNAFKDASSFNQDISSWDVSRVSDMKGMFYGARVFNQPIGSWDVSNATNMSYMFSAAESFNQPIGNWNVSNVTNMSTMFNLAKSFNQPIGNWNVSKVANMSYMFGSADSFNQPIGNWNVSNVTDAVAMFRLAQSFNQPIVSWNVSKVTDMHSMFHGARVFNQQIGNWNVSKVANMSYMFGSADSFNQPIGNWNVSNVNNMNHMFNAAQSFNQPIVSWNVSKVTDMHSMFHGARVFNQQIGNWNVSKVANMSYMFGSTDSFNQPIGNWNVSKVTDMHGMFDGAIVFNQPIGGWNVSKVANMNRMFSYAHSFNQDLSSWNVSNVSPQPPRDFRPGTTWWTLPKPRPDW